MKVNEDLELLADWWASAAGAITAAGFRAALGALHHQLAEAPPGLGGTGEEAMLAVQAGMVQAMLDALIINVDSSQGAAVAHVCAVLLLSSSDFRADLVQVLRDRPEIAPGWACAAQEALDIDDLRGPSAHGIGFCGDAQVAEALLARLAAGCGAGAQVGAVRGAAGWNRSGTCTLLITHGMPPLPTTSSTSMHALPDAWLMPSPAAALLRSQRGIGCPWCACCKA